MAVTPKISDLKEINELLLLIKQLEDKKIHQLKLIESLKAEYKNRLTREESILAQKFIVKKRLLAFDRVINDLRQEESGVVDSLKVVKDTINSFLNGDGLTKYITNLANKHDNSVVIVGEDQKQRVPSGLKTLNGKLGQLRLKTENNLYIFDPETLTQELSDRYIQGIVAN